MTRLGVVPSQRRRAFRTRASRLSRLPTIMLHAAAWPVHHAAHARAHRRVCAGVCARRSAGRDGARADLFAYDRGPFGMVAIAGGLVLVGFGLATPWDCGAAAASAGATCSTVDRAPDDEPRRERTRRRWLEVTRNSRPFADRDRDRPIDPTLVARARAAAARPHIRARRAIANMATRRLLTAAREAAIAPPARWRASRLRPTPPRLRWRWGDGDVLVVPWASATPAGSVRRGARVRRCRRTRSTHAALLRRRQAVVRRIRGVA
jgi:hypothetical protein